MSVKLEEQEKALFKSLGLPIYCGVIIKLCNEFNVKLLLDKLLEHNYIDSSYFLTREGRDIYRTLYKMSGCSMDNETLEKLYVEMRECFPKGNKPSTNKSWRSNMNTVINKLKRFFSNYGEATYDEVIQATKNYTNYYKKRNDYTYMRVLEYFISKYENGEEKSALADEIAKIKNGDTKQYDNSDEFLEVDNEFNSAGVRVL